MNKLKASVELRSEPPATTVKTAASSADSRETDRKRVRSHGKIGQHQEKLVAILKLGSPCQGMIVHEDKLQSNRLPGNMVIIHGDRNAIELKILMHRQGYEIRLFQREKEIEDDFRLKTLCDRIFLHVLEEPLPRSCHTPHLHYAVNQSLVGTALANDPHVPCVLPPHAPWFASFIRPEAQYSAVVLNVEYSIGLSGTLRSPNRGNSKCSSVRSRDYYIWIMWMQTTFRPSGGQSICPMGCNARPMD